MKILVIGASSYVGAKIYVDLKDKLDIFATYNSNKLFDELMQLDITKKEDVKKLITEICPQVIIHVAANASGTFCDENPDLADKINVGGTKNIVDAANSINCKVIFISSFAALDPVNLYGKTKLKGEKIIENTNSGYNILRPSFILGYSPNTKNDRPFNRLLKNLIDDTPAIYDDSWKFQPTYLRNISEIILELIKRNIWNEKINIAINLLKSRYDTAVDILSPFELKLRKVEKQEVQQKNLLKI